ncbi:hypothetical protein INT45_004195, partial [Circinella minor]
MIATIILGFIIILLTWRWLQFEPLPLGKRTTESQWSTKINEIIHDLPSFIPTWLRVYAIGIVDTLSTVVWRRLVKANDIGQFLYTFKEKHEQSNRLCILTGGDSGIGLEIARGLLEAGVKVIIASRSIEFAQKVKIQLGSDNMDFLIMDLTSFKSVYQFVDQVKKMIPKGGIDILINNAGIMNTPCHITSDNFESQFQTNCLSPFYLSLLLLPWMNKKDGRILFAASSTLHAASPRLDLSLVHKKYELDGLTHYAHSKLFVTILTQYLQNQLSQTNNNNIQVYCYHPGAVRTKLFSHTTLFTLPILSYLFDFIMLTPTEGAITPLYLCFASFLQEEKRISGRYWSSTVQQPVPECDDLEHVEKIGKAALDFLDLTPSQMETFIH